eukprot:SAG25_NODE_357_length_9189_cov_5.378218_9_plen_174_part_00
MCPYVLCRQGKLKKHNTKGGTNDYEFLLFTDILVYASTQLVTGKYTLHGMLDLVDCRVSALTHSQDPDQQCFMMENPKKPFRVQAASTEESTEWRLEIETAIVNAGGTKSTERRKVGGGAAVIVIEIVSARVVDEEGYEDKKYVLFDVRARNLIDDIKYQEEKRFSEFAALRE